MNILILQGSPNKKGNTAALAKSCLEGILSRHPDAAVAEFWLNDLSIRPCQACFQCRGKARCVIQDDMQLIYPALEAADLVLFAVPIYWWHLNAQTKLCLDRFTALLSPDDKLPALEGKTVVLVVSYNYESCAECTIKMFEDFKSWIGITLEVVRHCAKDGPASSLPQKMREAYDKGRSIEIEPPAS
ncbi:MAG: flavodoxin family protein [Anaerolineales bacterium]|nr:flavodoxin family protein [Anaerolineales bacterium]